MTNGHSMARGCILVAALGVAACSPGAPSVTDIPPSAAEATATPSAGPTATPSPSAAAIAVLPDEPWILFQQFRSKETVVLARPDGSDLHTPTGDVEGWHQTNPDWSPDGSTIVFARSDRSREDLWTVQADGTGARRLVACEDGCRSLDDPDWSPDGRTVLYSRNATTSDGTAVSVLEQVDVGTGAVTAIVTAEPGFFYAGQRWSPDGRSIVLEVVEMAGTSADSEVVDVALAVVDVAEPRPAGRVLTKRGTFPETAAWVPSGDRIVFAALERPGSNATDLYAIAPDGSGLRRLTTLADEGGSATHPDVTLDGGAIVFAAALPGQDHALARVAIDGGEIEPALGDTFISGVHPRVRPLP